MKKVSKYIALAGLGCVALSSCDNEKFLEVPLYNIVQMDAMFQSDDNARLGLNGIYAYNDVSPQDNSWGYKPNLFTGSHPTMDTQCTGWDVKFLNQTWDATVGELGEGWSHCYTAIARANDYLAKLKDAENISADAKSLCEGEARALRAYFYTWLATTFGRVPMLATGETFVNTPEKAAAETYEEMWDFIIEDFSKAAELLDWTPYNGQYGRCTKGMAKAYLADAYMWKAYRCPSVASDCYSKATAQLEEIYAQKGKVYDLATNFATNWDPAGFWNKECIWAMCSDEGAQWSSWGGDRTITFCNPNMFKWFTACTENGGWGSQYLSWEWYACYEPGDTRRDASCATGLVDDNILSKWGLEKSTVTGWHPYLGCVVGASVEDKGLEVKPDASTRKLHNGTKEYAPSIWTTKIWRNAYADGNSWGTQMWSPTIIYGKRFANVMLDLAECYFRTGKDSKGWELIDELRNRAWGNLTVGQDYSKYLGHMNEVRSANGKAAATEYPIGVLKETVKVPSAKEYYTQLQMTPNRKGYMHTSEAWKVAVNEERRKEFNSEWCLCPDMVRSGYIRDHIDYNYPKDDGGADYPNYPWTKRDFDFDINKMDMPIPAVELRKNPALKQNPGY